jgi:hypothetical protein
MKKSQFLRFSFFPFFSTISKNFEKQKNHFLRIFIVYRLVGKPIGSDQNWESFYFAAIFGVFGPFFQFFQIFSKTKRKFEKLGQAFLGLLITYPTHAQPSRSVQWLFGNR